MNVRFKPGQMVMHDAVPFGQLWTYYADHPIDAMMDPEYFRLHASFRAGDSMRILQTDHPGKKVLEMAEVLITSASPLEFYVTRAKTSVQRKKPGPKPKEAA